MKITEPNQRLQTMRFTLPVNAIAQGPHVRPETLGKIKNMRKLVYLLVALAVAILLIPFISTYQRVIEARQRLSQAKSLVEVEATLGRPNYRFDDYKQLKGWKERFGIDVSPGDILWIANREGFPYWVILVVSEDGIGIKSSYAGYYPLLK